MHAVIIISLYQIYYNNYYSSTDLRGIQILRMIPCTFIIPERIH